MEGSKKRNVTLSVDSDVVRRAKSSLVLSGKTMSEVFEEALGRYAVGQELDDLAEKLGIKLSRTSPKDIKKRRPIAPPGFNSAEVIRQMRESRT